MNKTQTTTKQPNNQTTSVTAPVVTSYAKGSAAMTKYAQDMVSYLQSIGETPEFIALHYLTPAYVLAHFGKDNVAEFVKSCGVTLGSLGLAKASEYTRQSGIMDERLERFLASIKARLTEETYKQALDLAQSKADRKLKGQGQLSTGLVREALADIFLSDVPVTSAGCPKGAKFQRIG